MARIEEALFAADRLDRLAAVAAPLQRLDPRAKVLVTVAFLVTVVSFPRYEIGELAPLFLYPAVLTAAGRIPPGILVRYLLLASPFAVLIGIFNPLFDREILAHWGPVAVTGGWLSFVSIILRFLLTVSAALILLAGTGFASVSAALGRLGAPRLLVTQFLLLYRFIFLVGEEGARMARAHALRAGSGRGPTLRVWGSLTGHLLLRALDRGARVHQAMLARGFAGTMPLSRPPAWSWADSAFVAGWLCFFALARFGHLAERLGRWALGEAG